MKRGQRLDRFIPGAVFGELDAEHGVSLVGIDSFHPDLAQSRRDQHSTRKIQYFIQSLLALEFVNGWASHHAADGYLWPDGRHQDTVSRKKTIDVGTNSVEKKIVEVHLANQF